MWDYVGLLASRVGLCGFQAFAPSFAPKNPQISRKYHIAQARSRLTFLFIEALLKGIFGGCLVFR